MLGKTNISPLEDKVIVTEIAEYEWIQQQIGASGNFVKTLFKNEYLVGITSNGTVAYTTDGEVWNTSSPEYNGIKLYDIEWDGSRFLLAGSYLEGSVTKPLILSTTNFASFELLDIETLYIDKSGSGRTLRGILAIYHDGGNYIVLADTWYQSINAVTLLYGDLETTITVVEVDGLASSYSGESLSTAKNSNKMILFRGYASGSPKLSAVSSDAISQIKSLSYNGTTTRPASVFECKDELYLATYVSETSYELLKVQDNNETLVMSTGINWMFTDGVYFNECQLFINNHNMLIVKKGESIGGKTLDDLVEIAPESSMTFIEKAYGQLFIFGKQGLILKSTNEVSNEEAIAVQSLSAKQALAQSKRYTDEQIAALEERVAALEEWRTEQATVTE